MLQTIHAFGTSHYLILILYWIIIIPISITTKAENKRIGLQYMSAMNEAFIITLSRLNLILSVKKDLTAFRKVKTKLKVPKI